MPRANSEYRIALWMVAGRVAAGGKNPSRALLTEAVACAKKVCRSKLPAERGIDAVRLADMRGF